MPLSITRIDPIHFHHHPSPSCSSGVALGCGSDQQRVQPAPTWNEVVKSGFTSVGSSCREQNRGETKPRGAETSTRAAVQCDMNNSAFRGLSIIVFHCLGLRDGESHLWEAPTNLSLSGKRRRNCCHLISVWGKPHGTTYRELHHLVFVLLATQN